MIPVPWVAVVLTLAAFRLTRFVGWDDLTASARAWATGRSWQRTASSNAAMGLTGEPGPPVAVYRRPALAHFLACPWCNGFWVSALVYIAWLLAPKGTLYASAPFALSAAVGLIAKQWDP